MCDTLTAIETRRPILILQHPQERDETLGTAWLAHRMLVGSQLAVGLSWPSLAAALGRPAEPGRWGVLHPGPAGGPSSPLPPGLALLGRGGAARPLPAALREELDGLVLLDGSWSQAKTLWWRNPWLLKARRLALTPPAASLYGALRREPRRDAVSTIEAAAYALAELEGRPALAALLLQPFAVLLERYRAAQKFTAARTSNRFGIHARRNGRASN